VRARWVRQQCGRGGYIGIERFARAQHPDLLTSDISTHVEVWPRESVAMANDIERIYHAWDDALGRKSLDDSLRLYAPSASLESPLVRHLLGTETGVVHGGEGLRAFVERVYQSQPAERRRFRSGYFTNGERLMWEYPRQTPDGDQVDLVEVMEVRDGLIQQHRVYWGWFGVKLLQGSGH
jgi:hypothetical protein